jgi:hypothetical protein
MNKKIIHMIVCILLIAVVVPPVKSLYEGTSYATVPSNHSAGTQGNWTELQKLLASDGAAGDAFGYCVSLSGDTALIGTPCNNGNIGAAYVFICTGFNWTQQAKLVASDETFGFGFSVFLDGDTAIIGVPYDDGNTGSAYIFTRTGSTWTQQAKLLALDSAPDSLFAWSVVLDTDTALIGAPLDNANGILHSGSAYAFIRTGSTWTQQEKIFASDGVEEDNFGFSVSLSGDTAIAGAPLDDGSGDNSGSAYVFTRTGTDWTEQAELLASDGTEGERCGWSVALDGDTAFAGAPMNDDHGANSGSTYVFTRTGTIWTEQQKIFGEDTAEFDEFGISVSLDGDTVLIGAMLDSINGNQSGSAYVFSRTGTTWVQQAKLVASDEAELDLFGYSVSLDAETALIGVYWDDDNGADSGSAFIFIPGSENEPPVAYFTWVPPEPTAGQPITFDASNSSDQDGVITQYEWDWNNDGQYEEGFPTPMATHSWSDAGNYSVTMRVTDDDGATSTITKTVTVTVMPIKFDIDITGGLQVKAIITNNGTIDASNVPWQIHVAGGIFGRINKTTNGTIDVAVGESKTVGTGVLFGLGSIQITARVDELTKTAQGTQFFIFTMVRR